MRFVYFYFDFLPKRASKSKTKGSVCCGLTSLRKHAFEMYNIFTALKNDTFQLKKFNIFAYFCSKHRL